MRQPSFRVRLFRVVLHLPTLALLAAGSLASAQRLAPGEVASSVTLSAVSELDTDIDGGGRFRWSGADLGLGVTRQFTPELSAGVTARFVAEKWSFDSPSVFGPVAPWTDIERPTLGLSLGYSLARDLSLFVAPQFGWSYESGAGTADGQTYGAVLGVTKVFSPTLFVGFGLGAFRQIDKTQYFPFAIVNWQITEALRLSNPLQAGPAGGAGLELSYAWSEGWEAGIGAAYREYRFRLRSDGPTPNGIGQNTGTPVFARLTHKLGPVAQLDLYAGAVVGGKLKVQDAAGATLRSTGYGVAPLFALSGTFNF